MTAPSTTSDLTDAVEAAKIDLPDLTQRVTAILAEPLYWFPVRHHSPAIARRLAQAIAARSPKIIFIEGPHEAQSMIEFVIDSKTRPPVAIYSSFRDDKAAAALAAANPGMPPPPPPRRSVWYPLTSYSPEYVTMIAAQKAGAAVVFMDLPHYATQESEGPLQVAPAQVVPTQVVPTPSSAASPAGGIPNPSPAPPAQNQPAAQSFPPLALPTGASAPPKPRRRDLDEIAPTSNFYQLLAKSAGHRSFGETWDRLFETPRLDETPDDLRRDVAFFCAAVRATTPAAMMQHDGTLERERFMWQTIQQTLKDRKIKPQDAMIVCGGFHIFMDRADPIPAPPIPEGTLSITVAPYSYFRISEMSGYGAGNRAPRFYEMCFDHHNAGNGQDHVVIDYIIDVLKEARRRGEPLSSADAIGATQTALMLARLRGRPDPVLDDIHDALITCCCKGNPKNDATHLFEAIDEVNIGTKLGRVTDRIGRLPIVSDFYDQLARHDFEETAAREKVFTYTLDKRQPADAAKSAFLHRMAFLEMEFGTVQREDAPFGQSIFKEHWRLKWSPKVEANLIEKSLHGDSIEAAATTVLRESLGSKAAEAGPACRKLVQAVDMDLPQLIAQAEQNTGFAIDHDEQFHSLADAMTSLNLLERYALFRNLGGGAGKQKMADLMARCFDRACCRIPEVASVPPEEWDNVIHGLLALAEPVVQRDDLDADLFAAHVERAAKISTMPFLRGAFLGVLTEMRRFKPDQIAAELLAFARGPTDQQILAGDFLHGVLRVSRAAIMLGGKSIIAAVDELLKGASPENFLSMVPRLRAAFETLHERQKDNVAGHVAELYGLKESTSLRSLTTSVGAAVLMAELDADVAKIMDEWLKP